MATLLYFHNSVAAPVSPNFLGTWSNTSIASRILLATGTGGSAMTTVSFSDADVTDQQILFRQCVSHPLTPGQTITGGQTWALQMRVSETATGNNLFLRRFICVVNGNTNNKSLVLATLDNLEAATTLTNRVNGGTTQVTNYTTVSGDRLLVELGMSGDPSGGGAPSHSSSMSWGNDAGSDLPVDDTTTTALNPWFSLTDTLTFTAEPSSDAQEWFGEYPAEKSRSPQWSTY